jgi:hypothetical protein
LRKFACASIGLALAVASTGTGRAYAASPSMLPSQFPGRVLAAHNLVRAQAGSAQLVWDPTLGTAAARYALQLAITNTFQHSDRKARPGTGENLWMGTRGAYSVETMVGLWASERRLFVPGTFPNNSRSGNWEDIGHYTQMIWPTTTRVGCALASNATTDYLVCRYSPAGNVDGRLVQASQRY